jgi:hypothetical protein
MNPMPVKACIPRTTGRQRQSVRPEYATNPIKEGIFVKGKTPKIGLAKEHRIPLISGPPAKSGMWRIRQQWAKK